jgi:hypothetical protein
MYGSIIGTVFIVLGVYFHKEDGLSLVYKFILFYSIFITIFIAILLIRRSKWTKSPSFGSLVLWFSGPLVLWSSGPLLLWSSGEKAMMSLMRIIKIIDGRVGEEKT